MLGSKRLHHGGSNVLILSPKTRGIPNTMLCRILVFRWPFGPLRRLSRRACVLRLCVWTGTKTQSIALAIAQAHPTLKVCRIEGLFVPTCCFHKATMLLCPEGLELGPKNLTM